MCVFQTTHSEFNFVADLLPRVRVARLLNTSHAHSCALWQSTCTEVLHVPPAIEAFGDGGTSVSVALKPEPRSEKYGQGGDYSTTMSESMVSRAQQHMHRGNI
eukprot:1532197-Amphidinium_carterae.1